MYGMVLGSRRVNTSARWPTCGHDRSGATEDASRRVYPSTIGHLWLQLQGTFCSRPPLVAGSGFRVLGINEYFQTIEESSWSNPIFVFPKRPLAMIPFVALKAARDCRGTPRRPLLRSPRSHVLHTKSEQSNSRSLHGVTDGKKHILFHPAIYVE